MKSNNRKGLVLKLKIVLISSLVAPKASGKWIVLFQNFKQKVWVIREEKAMFLIKDEFWAVKQ